MKCLFVLPPSSDDMPAKKRKGNWDELTFANSSGTIISDREKIGHFRVPKNLTFKTRLSSKRLL